MFSMVQVNRIYLIFNPVHFLVDSSEIAIFRHFRQRIADIIIFFLVNKFATRKGNANHTNKNY